MLSQPLTTFRPWWFNTVCIHPNRHGVPQGLEFGPALSSLSPNGTYKVTVAPVSRGPIGWRPRRMPTSIKAAGRRQVGVIPRLKSFVRSLCWRKNEGGGAFGATARKGKSGQLSFIFYTCFLKPASHISLECIIFVSSVFRSHLECPMRRTINSKYALKVTEMHVCSCWAQFWDKPVYWGLLQTRYICLVELQLGPEQEMDWWEMMDPTVAEQNPPHHHSLLGSIPKTLVAAGKLSLTYQPIPSAFILECCSRSLENQIKGLIKRKLFCPLTSSLANVSLGGGGLI